MSWNEKHIKQLLADGKIRGYQTHEKKKGFSADAGHQSRNKKTSKALAWLKLNLFYWANEHSLIIEEEYRFCERGWRWDFAISPDRLKIAIEYHGGIFMDKSGHTNVKGFLRDSDKQNRAVALGWRVITLNAMNYTTVLSQLNELIK